MNMRMGLNLTMVLMLASAVAAVDVRNSHAAAGDSLPEVYVSCPGAKTAMAASGRIINHTNLMSDTDTMIGEDSQQTVYVILDSTMETGTEDTVYVTIMTRAGDYVYYVKDVVVVARRSASQYNPFGYKYEHWTNDKYLVSFIPLCHRNLPPPSPLLALWSKYAPWRRQRKTCRHCGGDLDADGECICADSIFPDDVNDDGA